MITVEDLWNVKYLTHHQIANRRSALFQIRAKWEKKLFHCKEFAEWSREQSLTWDIWKTFDRLRLKGYVIHESGKTGSTIYSFPEVKP